jgi:hypothetical protein
VGLSMQSKLDIVMKVSRKYKRANKKEKGAILDTLVDLTGYNGTYASYLLGLCNKKVLVKRTDGKVYRITADPKAKKNRKRKKTYGPEILAPLKRIWAIMDFPYGKRLAPSMEWFVPKLESCGELDVTPEVREKLLCISAATIDRLLQVEWKKLTLKGRSYTKPGTLLKNQIPIRLLLNGTILGPDSRR